MVERTKRGEGRTPDGEPDLDSDFVDVSDRDFGWEEGDPADRRRDPLRQPLIRPGTASEE